jgi:hypothetical protein
MFAKVRKSTALAMLSAVVATVVSSLAIPMPDAKTNRFLAVGQRGASMTSYVIGIAVAALVVSIIVPIAFGQFFSTDTASWDAQTILIWGIIPLVVILAIVLFFLNKADDQS